MIKYLYDEFHQARLSKEHEKAMKIVLQLNVKYFFTKKDIITCLVNEDFKEDECCDYITKHNGWP